MSKPSFRALSVALLLVVPSAGVSLAQTVGGTWMITAMTEPQPQVDAVILQCQWKGTWELTETGGQVSGTVTLELDTSVMNDDGCPATMTSMISGTNNGGAIEGTIGGPADQLGEVSFTGKATSSDGSRAPASSASGSFSVVGGQYALNAGSWSGTMAPVMPTLPQVGLGVLLLLLLAGGGLLLLRRRPA